MSSFWQWLKQGYAPRPADPGAGPGRQLDLPFKLDGHPNGYAVGAAEGADRPAIFDPALRHYQMGFRRGDPAFADPWAEQLWRAAREGVMHHVLRVATAPPRDAQLVLRGSLLLRAWLGEAARPPGDLDFVVRPGTLAADGPAAREILEGIVAALAEQPETEAVRIDAEGITADSIWTYDRAEGRRLVIPWQMDEGPPGTVQVDIVFGEELVEEPIRATIPHPFEGETTAWAATAALSLAWKLLWLETDKYAQGKDLYDATLLAERTTLPRDLLIDVLTRYELWYEQNLEPDFAMRWEIDWDDFRLECPWVEGEAADWQARLTRALAPTFAPRTGGA